MAASKKHHICCFLWHMIKSLPATSTARVFIVQYGSRFSKHNAHNQKKTDYFYQISIILFFHSFSISSRKRICLKLQINKVCRFKSLSIIAKYNTAHNQTNQNRPAEYTPLSHQKFCYFFLFQILQAIHDNKPSQTDH